MTARAQASNAAKAARPRLGPRPLPLHLAAAASAWMSSRAGLQMLKTGSIEWNPRLAATARDLGRKLDGVDAQALDSALEREARRRLDELLAGILAYRRHPYRRNLADPPAVWSEGPMRLLDFGAVEGGAREGPPVFVIPALVNRAYVLDISERRSLLRYLARRGLRPLLMDWGAPGDVERRFTLTDYVTGRLEPALESIRRLTGRRPVAMGYCMGGLLTLALALRRRKDLAGMVVMATPWDFHAGNAAHARLAGTLLGPLEPVIERFGELPVDVLQALFATIDPLGVPRKFRAFAGLAGAVGDGAGDPARAEDFVALEDWLNDGVPLAGPVARECLGGWYGENTPARGRWHVAGRPVLPAEAKLPSLAVVPENDRIVPPQSARALAGSLPDAETLAPPLGHIGMVVAGRAEELVWRPLAAWLQFASDGVGKAPAARKRTRKAAGETGGRPRQAPRRGRPARPRR